MASTQNDSGLQDASSANPEITGTARVQIARVVTNLSIWGTIILGVLGIVFVFKLDHDENRLQLLQYVFTALLPLWGTWMGTVMAYYFSKENFLAANQSVQKLVAQITPEQKLESVKSKDVMIPFDKIKPFAITPAGDGTPPPDPIAAIKVADAIKFMNDNKITRLPLFADKKILRFIIHQSAFEKFIAELALNPATPPVITTELATIGDMKDKGSDQIKGFLINGAQFISQDSNLRQAQFLIEKNSFCQDVFVTATGKPDEEVLGWITNSIIAEQAKV